MQPGEQKEHAGEPIALEYGRSERRRFVWVRSVGAWLFATRRRGAGVVIAGLVLAAAIAAYMLGCMPGTLEFDASGRPHGSGVRVYRYKGGQVKLEERYRAGKIVHSAWFRPDGSVVARTAWKNESGTGYYLREDGSIHTQMQYVNGLAEGKAMYYGLDGGVEREALFRGGKPVEPATQTSGRGSGIE